MSTERRYHRGVFHLRRPRLMSVVALPLVVFIVACSSEQEATTGPMTAVPSRTATTTDTPTATATPTPTPTADEPVASTFAIPTEELPVAVLTRSDGTRYELPLEVPPRDEYSVGLSGRYELDGRGMLFWYGELVQQPFWMKDTHIDLSIAFVDEEGVIVDIFDMEAESEEFRMAASFYRFAVEAPLAWYAERGLAAGDSVALDFPIPESLRQ
jgi:uncharacterized membrane protein (UPF0127 family)